MDSLGRRPVAHEPPARGASHGQNAQEGVGGKNRARRAGSYIAHAIDPKIIRVQNFSGSEIFLALASGSPEVARD